MANPIRKLMNCLDLNAPSLAKLLGCDYAEIRVGEERDKMCKNTRKKLRNLEKIIDCLEKASTPKDLRIWLKAKDVNFCNHTPMDLLGSDYATEELLDYVRRPNE